MGTLYIVSTPIGNLEDITLRALTTLFSVDILACEDTRRTGQLLELLKEKYAHILPLDAKKPKFVSYYDQIEEKIMPELIQYLEKGTSIGLVSDAGTPMIADPGYRLVQSAIKRSIPTVVVPGASAFLTALVGSGMPVNAFTFIGYLSDKDSKRKTMLRSLQKSVTYICYVAPHKLLETLHDMEELYGDIPIVLARELTKMHEEYFRGTIAEALLAFANPKGEFVLLFTL